MLNVFVSKIRLQRPGMVTAVRQRITAGVPEHVRVRLEAEFRLDPRAPGKQLATGLDQVTREIGKLEAADVEILAKRGRHRQRR